MNKFWANPNLAAIDYGGYRLEKRLDARWAVFMDTFRWHWEYERSYNQPSYFILHNVKIVYPTHKDNPLINQTVRIIANEDFDKIALLMANIISSCGENALMVGSIPDGATDKDILSDLKEMAKDHYEGPELFRNRTYQFFPGKDPDVQCINSLFSSLWVDDDSGPVIGAWHTREGRGDGNVSKTLLAYKHARQARFEHGECGYHESASNY